MTSMENSFERVLIAPAKINLALHVIGQKPDGYHLLESIVTFADRGDRIGFSHAETDRFTISGPFAADVPADGPAAADNLVLKARDGLRRLLTQRGLGVAPVHLHLEKNLPVASGIGGGSADAAATLHGLLALWSAPVSDRAFGTALAALALELGADVPMCLHGKPLVARGIGEHTETLAGFPAFPMLLVNPRLPVSTPAIFKALASKTNPPLALPEGDPSPGQWLAALSAMRNDLEPPARQVQPVIATVSQALSDSGALFARMSGSGATCFGLFTDTDARDRASVALSQQHPDWYVLSCFSLQGDADDAA